MVNSNHDPLHTIVKFHNGDEDCIETKVIDEEEWWKFERNSVKNFGEKMWKMGKNEWKILNFSIEITYICMVNI